MEPRQAISKKPFVSEEENNCEEETSLKPQDRIGNIDWCKCECECKLTVTFTESVCCRHTNEIPDENFEGT